MRSTTTSMVMRPVCLAVALGLRYACSSGSKEGLWVSLPVAVVEEEEEEKAGLRVSAGFRLERTISPFWRPGAGARRSW